MLKVIFGGIFGGLLAYLNISENEHETMPIKWRALTIASGAIVGAVTGGITKET